MQNAFDYAGCDANGSNCTGPKRVRAFKQKANEFFDPYENVLDEVYDALILAQSLGVDITDIYMMLNGSCNVWGKYMCETCNRGDKNCDYDTNTGRGYYQIDYTTDNQGNRRVNPKQSHCTLLNMLTNQEDVQQNWLDMDAGSSGGIRVACASDAIENSALFRNRKKQATIDIETLQRMIDQDATSSAKPENAMKFCAISDREVLEKAVNLKNLPSKVCIPDRELNNRGYTQTVFSESLNSSNTPAASVLTGINCVDGLSSNSDMCKCENTGGNWVLFSSKCNCGYKKYNRVTKECEGGAFGLDLPEFAPLQASNALPEKNTPKLNMPGLTKEDLGDAFRQRNANQ